MNFRLTVHSFILAQGPGQCQLIKKIFQLHAPLISGQAVVLFLLELNTFTNYLNKPH